MKRWAAITALAVMAVPTAFTLGAMTAMAFMSWRWHATMVSVGRSRINPYGAATGSDIAIAALAALAAAVWWFGWHRLARPGGSASKPLAPIGAIQILATEFLFFLVLPSFLILSKLSLL